VSKATRGAPSREALAGSSVELLRLGSWSSPDVSLVRDREGLAVVKDFSPRRFFVRATLGRWLTARELAAHRALADHPAVPALFGRIDALALAIEYRAGEPLSRDRARALRPSFARELREAVGEMHRLGVAHLDLRHYSNVLAGKDGGPVLLDFASAIRFRPGSVAARWILPLLARIDQRAVRKWEARLAGLA
jgi:RIO-like serine/threonine protein kinase